MSGACDRAGQCSCSGCPNHDTGINGTGHCDKHSNGCHVMCRYRL